MVQLADVIDLPICACIYCRQILKDLPVYIPTCFLYKQKIWITGAFGACNSYFIML